GEWSKPKTLALSSQDVDRLADPHDREIFSLLFGAADPLIHLGVPYDAGVPRPSRFRLSTTLADRVVPAVVRAGRAYLSRAAGAPALLPLDWDDGAPWRFDVLIVERPEEGSFHIDGEFVRWPERMSLAEPVLVLQEGFLFTRSKAARVDVGGAFTWLTHL